MTITHERVKELFDYHPDGELIRKIRASNQPAGKVLGCISLAKDEKYYKIAMINYKFYSLHQLIYFYHHKSWAKRIDHIDGNGLNNKIENLRECTQSQNIANSKIGKANTSGFKGVTYRKDTNKWQAAIMLNGKHISLGSYEEKEDAAKAYDNSAKKLRGEFAKTNF